MRHNQDQRADFREMLGVQVLGRDAKMRLAPFPVARPAWHALWHVTYYCLSPYCSTIGWNLSTKA